MSNLRTYLAECCAQAPHSWRAGSVVMAVLINGALLVGLYVGWHLEAYPIAYFLAGAALVAALDIVLILPFKLWKAERAKLNELENKLQPKLICSFNDADPGCKRSNTVITQTGRQSPSGELITVQAKCDWYRMKVETIPGGLPQTGCCARLTTIKRGDNVLMSGESPLLSFAPGEQPDATNKTIHPDVPEFVDVVAVTYGEQPQVFLPLHGNRASSSVDWANIFSLPGDYYFEVSVVSEKAPTVNARLLFHWTLNPATSKASWVKK